MKASMRSRWWAVPRVPSFLSLGLLCLIACTSDPKIVRARTGEPVATPTEESKTGASDGKLELPGDGKGDGTAQDDGAAGNDASDKGASSADPDSKNDGAETKNASGSTSNSSRVSTAVVTALLAQCSTGSAKSRKSEACMQAAFLQLRKGGTDDALRTFLKGCTLTDLKTEGGCAAEQKSYLGDARGCVEAARIVMGQGKEPECHALLKCAKEKGLKANIACSTF